MLETWNRNRSVYKKTMKILTLAMVTVSCVLVISVTQISFATQAQEQISGLIPAGEPLESVKNTDNNFPQRHSVAINNANDLFDGEFKKPYPVRRLYKKDKNEDFIKFPHIEKVHNSDIDEGVYVVKKVDNISELIEAKVNKGEISFPIADNLTEKLKPQQSITDTEQSQIKQDLAESQKVKTLGTKKILGKKRVIDDVSNSKQLNDFLSQNLDISDIHLEKQILTLSKFVYPTSNDNANFRKNKENTIHTLTQEIGQQFFLKPLFLLKFSHTLITNSDKIRRFSNFWKLLLMRNVINTRKISYINEQKQTITIDVENEALISKIDNILRKYISNSEKTINKIIQSMEKLKHLDATVEYEMDQVKCFINILQNSDEIRKISWNIAPNKGSISSTIGDLFDNKFQTILNEYFVVFNTVVNSIKQANYL